MDEEKRVLLVEAIKKFHKQTLSNYYSTRAMTIDSLESCPTEFVETNYRCDDIDVEEYEWFKANLSFSRCAVDISRCEKRNLDENTDLPHASTVILKDEVVIALLWHGFHI